MKKRSKKHSSKESASSLHNIVKDHMGAMTYSLVIITTVVVASLIDAWNQGWPMLVILLMAFYNFFDPFKSLVKKHSKVVVWLILTLCLLFLVGLIVALIQV